MILSYFLGTKKENVERITINYIRDYLLIIKLKYKKII